MPRGKSAARLENVATGKEQSFVPEVNRGTSGAAEG